MPTQVVGLVMKTPVLGPSDVSSTSTPHRGASAGKPVRPSAPDIPVPTHFTEGIASWGHVSCLC